MKRLLLVVGLMLTTSCVGIDVRQSFERYGWDSRPGRSSCTVLCPFCNKTMRDWRVIATQAVELYRDLDLSSLLGGDR